MFHALLLSIVAVAFVAAVFDWRTGTIPNWLTLGTMAVSPLIHFGVTYAEGHDKRAALLECGVSIGGLVLCLLVPWLFYRQNAIGGGDVKLFGALGALGQVSLGLEVQVFGLLCLALTAPAVLAYKGVLLTTLKNTFAIMLNGFLPKDKQKTIEGAAYSWFKLGPAVFLASVFVAYSHWNELRDMVPQSSAETPQEIR